MKNLRIIICSNIFVFLTFSYLPAQDINSIPAFHENDRVLVLSPHPDDETIGVAGAIQKAKEAGAQVKIAWLTNGDNNELAFIAYEKELVIGRDALLKMGELRRAESVAALDVLGVSKDNLVFLGYPDFGTLDIFREYWGETKPFRSMLTRVTQVSYPESPSYGKPYVGESILEDFKSILKEYHPTKIFVTMPSDTNPDHRSIGLFLQVALWDLEGKIPKPQVFPFIVHVPNWPLPRGFNPQLPLDPPQSFSGTDVNWMFMLLTEMEIDRKKEAIAQYKSQNASNPTYLYSFARHNELFGIHPVIDLEQTQEINWEKINEFMRIEGREIDESKPENKNIEAVLFAQKEGYLHVRIKLKNLESELFGTHLFLFGYRKDTPFANMPKLRFILRWPFEMVILDKKHPIFVKRVKCQLRNKFIELTVPLVALGNPRFILTSASTWASGLAQDATGWRILEME